MQGTVIKVVAMSLLGGCATRRVPASFPENAPASEAAVEAGLPDVGRFVREEPPLPGDPTGNRSGLEEHSEGHRAR